MALPFFDQNGSFTKKHSSFLAQKIERKNAIGQIRPKNRNVSFAHKGASNAAYLLH